MKAAVIHDFGQPLQIEEMPVREPGQNEILVKVIACGVCHTDLHACMGDWPVKPKMPLIPGHEAIGYVVALGSGVQKIKEGDIVGVPWLYSACGRIIFPPNIAAIIEVYVLNCCIIEHQ